ncbi:site-specific integrase [Runella aurantiaca]|uniref:Site-specific integrase n=1 Tax=Runella aurantiaca TaxID=2282308 RepID=A0A369IF86_9BACT|nr:site-specific integrase [Runella aurantiaca]RDB06915.1 site-specific integrase [Runella aurantiaca]
MKSHIPTANVILDTRKEKNDGTYPLKLRITFNRARKYFNVGLPSLSLEDYKKLDSSKVRDPFLKDVKVNITARESRALDVFSQLNPFSFDEFEKLFFPKEDGAVFSNVYTAFDSYITKLKQQGRVSTATSYESAKNSLQQFKKKLMFEDITPDFLNSYERFMLASDKSSTTVGIYLRSLRTIYNQAIENGIIGREKYPFRKSKFQIPAGQNIKKALSLAELKQIFEYEAIPNSPEDKAKDFWIFSYLCNGINIKDICRLKYSNLDGDRIAFQRAKTEHTKKGNQKQIVVYLSEQAKAIITKWGNPNRLPSNYIFPILQPNIDPQRERELVQYLTKQVNKYMKRIVAELEIDKPVTTYAARHSFSTVLKRSGAPIEFISESLGHNSLKTTEHYLDSFEDDVKKKYAESLTNFN